MFELAPSGRRGPSRDLGHGYDVIRLLFRRNNGSDLRMTWMAGSQEPGRAARRLVIFLAWADED